MNTPDRRAGRAARRTPPGTVPPPLSADERRLALVRLVPMWPAEIDDLSVLGRRRLVGILERALLAERRRGRAGHWTYDLARHGALLAAWRRERAALDALIRTHIDAEHEKGRRPRGQHPR